MERLTAMQDEELKHYDCIIVDEAQFATKAQVEFLVHIVDDLGIPVICYGLRTDFKREFFEGSMWLMAWADQIEEIKTVCWCGKAATCNARIGEDGRMIREGDQIVMGGNDCYTSLCRKHHRQGNLGPRTGKMITEEERRRNRFVCILLCIPTFQMLKKPGCQRLQNRRKASWYFYFFST